MSDNYIEPLLNAGCHSGPQAATAHVAPNRAQLLRAAWCISILCTSAHYTDGACTTLQEKVFKQSTKLLGRHVYCTHQVYHHVQYKQCATLRGYEPAAPIGAADNKQPGHIGCTKQANLAPSKLHQANLLAPDELQAHQEGWHQTRAQDLVIKGKYQVKKFTPGRPELPGPQFGVIYMTVEQAWFLKNCYQMSHTSF